MLGNCQSLEGAVNGRTVLAPENITRKRSQPHTGPLQPLHTWSQGEHLSGSQESWWQSLFFLIKFFHIKAYGYKIPEEKIEMIRFITVFFPQCLLKKASSHGILLNCILIL